MDFWKAWSVQTGVRVKFVHADWPTSIQMVRDGRADVHGGIYYTADRDAYLDFSSPLFQQTATLFVRSSLLIKRVSDLRGKYIAVLEDGYSESWLAEHYPELQRRTYPTLKAMVQAALNGSVDALLSERLALAYELGATGHYKDYTPLKDMYEASLRVAVAQRKYELLRVVDMGIREIGDDDRSAIFERWIVPEETLPGWLWPAVAVGLLTFMVGLASVFTGGRWLG